MRAFTDDPPVLRDNDFLQSPMGDVSNPEGYYRPFLVAIRRVAELLRDRHPTPPL
ncbi:MAG: hypothetical protein UZ21_OP11001000673 [Microgenomates bacterium OLB22]|nr:MAG: hypothetical protein UZ21_OP11001000673 [Microgenomates bacterium OLB22]